MYGVQLEARLRQPLLEVGDRRWVVIVEVRPRREELDRLEPEAAHLQEMVPGQPMTVIQVRR